MIDRKIGRVYLVGAGPGDPGLLTLRAVECLREADFVLYDYLTSPRVLAHAPPHAVTMCVDTLPGEHPQRWPHIHQRIINEAKQGKVVVHLKGGDPLIFGRGGEEAEALREAEIPYEIVPGVTAALAAGAYAEIPLTHRKHASAVAFVTGHEHPGKPTSRINWDAIASFPGTLAFYMSVARLPAIAKELIARGQSPDTPAAMVHQASTGGQRVIVGTLATLDDLARQAGVTSPSVMIVGEVVALKPEKSWFEARPLAGLRVLVTRPRQQALEFARHLERLGAIPTILPILEIRPPVYWSAVDAAIQQLRSRGFDWIVFTSVNAVSAFFGRLKDLSLDARILGNAQLAAIGSTTAATLAGFHIVPDLFPTDEMTSEQLVEQLREPCRGKRVLLPRAAQGRRLLEEQLGAIAEVEAVAVYRQEVVVDESNPVFDQLRRGEIDVVTLTSPNIAREFLSRCDTVIKERFRNRTIKLLANSKRLETALAEDDFPVISSTTATTSALTDLMMRLENRNGNAEN